VFRTLSEVLKCMGKAANETVILKKEEMRLKGEADILKKDRIKDMHASISNMILMASATDLDWIGTFSNSFKAFYNSKNQGYADLELHHQFDAKDLQNLGFAEGTVLALWSGLLKRLNPTAPSNCTPYAFCELQPMNMNQKSRSLICTMINQRGGLAQSTEEIKAKAKQEVLAPENYNKMLFQLKAFVALIKILFGDKSITALKLQAFVRQIETHNVFYKGYAALDDFFPTKVLWTVCTRFQLYLENCTRAKDQKEVDCSLINFSPDHRDIITSQFNVILPASFKAVESASDEEPKEKGGAGSGMKSKKMKQEEEKEKRSKKSADNVVENKQQCLSVSGRKTVSGRKLVRLECIILL
jgi:hypothetical protein